MKTNFLKSLLGLTLIAFIFSGCDKLDDASTLKFDADFDLPNPFIVNEGASDPENPYFSVNSSVDVEQDAEVKKYKDKIKDIKVNKITYTISEVDGGPATLTSGKATFYSLSQNGVGTGVIASVSGIALTSTSGELEVNQAGLDKIGDLLLDDGVVVVVCEANISDSPIYFKINVTLNVTITANALN